MWGEEEESLPFLHDSDLDSSKFGITHRIWTSVEGYRFRLVMHHEIHIDLGPWLYGCLPHIWRNGSIVVPIIDQKKPLLNIQSVRRRLKALIQKLFKYLLDISFLPFEWAKEDLPPNSGALRKIASSVSQVHLQTWISLRKAKGDVLCCDKMWWDMASGLIYNNPIN